MYSISKFGLPCTPALLFFSRASRPHSDPPPHAAARCFSEGWSRASFGLRRREKGVAPHALPVSVVMRGEPHAFPVSVVAVLGHLLTPFKTDSSVPPGAIVPHQTLFARRITYSLHHIARCLLTPVPDSTGESKSIRPASTLSAIAGGRTAGMPPGYTAMMRRFFARSRLSASRSCGLVNVEITGGGSGG